MFVARGIQDALPYCEHMLGLKEFVRLPLSTPTETPTMVALTTLATLVAAIFAATVSARFHFDFDITFTHYTTANCSGPNSTMHMQNARCYPFQPQPATAPFLGFAYNHYSSWGNDRRKGCAVTMHPDYECKSPGVSLGDAKETFRQCGTYTDAVVPGRGYQSVSVLCGAKEKARLVPQPPKDVVGDFANQGTHGGSVSSSRRRSAEGEAMMGVDRVEATQAVGGTEDEAAPE
ncbi:hypothetical protein LTR53_016601 [Teratosphaeriaceae sp. CCFEE 6253]|nr:hypothetical protein LTR53_016601 [Teratosphaeriaceae sp. CCFEE 6253]